MRSEATARKHGERWWRRVIGKQSKTLEPVAAVCLRYGISTKSFYTWRKKLQDRPLFSQLEIGLVNECEVRCRSGRSVVVRGAVSPAVLGNILLAAEAESL